MKWIPGNVPISTVFFDGFVEKLQGSSPEALRDLHLFRLRHVVNHDRVVNHARVVIHDHVNDDILLVALLPILAESEFRSLSSSDHYPSWDEFRKNLEALALEAANVAAMNPVFVFSRAPPSVGFMALVNKMATLHAQTLHAQTAARR